MSSALRWRKSSLLRFESALPFVRRVVLSLPCRGLLSRVSLPVLWWALWEKGGVRIYSSVV